MREFSLPALYEVPTDGNLTDIVRRNAAQHPDVAVIARKVGGVWQDVDAVQFLTEVRTAAKGLIAAGVQPGDRVALMSRTRYEWTLLDFAIWSAGAVTVPVYETSSPEQVQWILADSGATAMIVELDGHTAAVESVRDQLPALKHVWQIEGGGVEELGRLGQGVTDAGRRGAQLAGEGRRPGDHRLHLRHHRPPQGVCPHPPQLLRRVRERGGAAAPPVPYGRVLGPALPPARACLRAARAGRADDGADQAGHRPGHQEPHGRAGLLPADADPRCAARLREGLQLGAGQGAGGRQGQDLRQGRGHGDRVQQGAGHRVGPGARAEDQAQGVRQARLQQAAGGARRQGRVRDLGRRPAGRAPGPLLPRYRLHGPGGLRPDRVLCGDRVQPLGPPEDRYGRAAAAGFRHPDRGRRGGAAARRAPVQGVLEQPGRDRGGAGRRLVPHRRHRHPRRGRLPQRSPAARRRSSSPRAARTSPRP